jgi:histidinol-phosphate aminotransferase
MLRMVDEIVAQRDRMSATLDALGYEPYQTWTNFVLFGGVDDPASTWQALYDRGVLVRDVGLAHTLRVSAGTADETTAFLDALASIDSRA